MINIISGDKQIPLDFDKYYVTEKYNGRDEIGFTLPLDHPACKEIHEETAVWETTGGQQYLIKALDEGAQTVNIKGQLDLDELQADMFLDYSNHSDTAAETIRKVLPQGWTVQDHALKTQSRTIELEAATPLEIIESCPEVYGIVCRYDNKRRVVHLYDPEAGETSGVYLTDELNLKEVNYKGKSDGFATRLYARGKDGLTFADINDGKEYVDDHTYSDKVVSVYWKDERYTVKENLLADAKKNLASMAVPQQSYECNVIDLARARERESGKDENIYSFLDFALYQPVILLDRRRHRRITHRVVEIKRYPHYPEDNEIKLSTVAPSVQSTIKTINTQINKPTSGFRQQMQVSIKNATEWITGSKGGYVVFHKNSEGQPDEILVMDTADIATAKKVWRWNQGGLGYSNHGYNGPYSTAITQDGAIIADFITAGTLYAGLIKTGVLQSKNGKTSINMDTGESNMTGTYISEWTFSDGRKGKITINPGGVTFYLNGNHRGSMFLAQNGELVSTAQQYNLHYRDFVGDYTAPNQDTGFAWMGEDKKTNIKVENLNPDKSDVKVGSRILARNFSLQDDNGNIPGWLYLTGENKALLQTDHILLSGSQLVKRTATIDGQTINYIGW